MYIAEFVAGFASSMRSEEHTSELQSRSDLVCRLLLEKKKKTCICEEYTTELLRLACRQRVLPLEENDVSRCIVASLVRLFHRPVPRSSGALPHRAGYQSSTT